MQGKVRDFLLAGTVIPMLVMASSGRAEPSRDGQLILAQNADDQRHGGGQREFRAPAGNPAGQSGAPAPRAIPVQPERPVQRMEPPAVQRPPVANEAAPRQNQMQPRPTPALRQVPAQIQNGVTPGLRGNPPVGAAPAGAGGQQQGGFRQMQAQPVAPGVPPASAPRIQGIAPSQTAAPNVAQPAPRSPGGAPVQPRQQNGQPAPVQRTQAQPPTPIVPPVPAQQQQGNVPNRIGAPSAQPLPGQRLQGGAPGQPGAPGAPGAAANPAGNDRARGGGAFPAPPPPPVAGGQPPGQNQPGSRRNGGNGGAVAAGAAVGFVGGFLAAQGVDRLDEVRSHRQEMRNNGIDIIREPGRTIVEQDNQIFVAHDENQRFRDLGYDVRSQRQGGYDVAFYDRPDGSRIYTYTDGQGRLIRRIRQFPDGRQIFLIDNRYGDAERNFQEDVVDLPPPQMDLPPDQYVVDADTASEAAVYDALEAPPVAPLPQRYTLDQIRYSLGLRARMRSVDLNTINFATGSWAVTPDQAGRLSVIAQAILRAVQRNPQEVFMIEGYTDAVGNPVDNLSLSDRRAQSVATILTQDFQVPAENLVTQGYGAQYLKVNTQAANVQNRRVTARRITPLLNQQ